ncbi:uncharacterized protein J4E87_006166 [Alternaria ethzedia]|uniref:uncharacterized protein n=1 Tax=Alternaria ethzedia TaxID=181014 RepID=UPI0020C1DEFE|nr:uncharacterized protein J4E87_006166 [Alternaria ethzedia]KAI4622599.1 hypothetical protein J4E87_006166 [Alternaria ethzedia]
MDGLSSVIVPLYVYPSAGAWDPFHDVYDTVPLLLSLLIIPGLTPCTAFRASSFPRIHFTVVVNVHNGPGEGALPNAEYTAAIEALNSLSNVRTIGYVATTWCTRDLSSVLDDIAAFSFWGEYDSSLALSGVFVDETPTQYSTDYAVYLDSIAQAVQDSTGLKDNYIVHNPGALPEPRYFDEALFTGPDLTVVFENSFSNWTTESGELFKATGSYDREKLALLVHSTPDLSILETASTLLQLLAVGRGIWLTGSSNYTELDGVLPAFIEGLDALLS